MCLMRNGKIDYFKPVRSNCTTTKRLKELKIAIEVFDMVFGAVYQDHFFKFKFFYHSLHPNSDADKLFDIFCYDNKQRKPYGSIMA